MGGGAVRVVIRVRQTEQLADALHVDPDGRTIRITQPGGGVSEDKEQSLAFCCDEVLLNSSQQKVFDAVGLGATEAVLEGYHGTIICYGQTGAGKSFTMIGADRSYAQRGLAPRCLAHLFHQAANRPELEYTLRLSCLEIYNETLYDLLATLPSHGERPELSVSERGGQVSVKGLSSHEVQSEEAALQLLFEAESNRAVAQHQLNQHSSRSHVLYVVEVERRSKVIDSATVTARLTLVDLAGSERLKKSGAREEGAGEAERQQQQRLAKEAMTINKSLSFLEQVVLALVSRKPHVPHRSCKLTSVLRNSLGGNCRVTLVANVYGEGRHLEETFSTLKFASRMQQVTTNVVVNAQKDSNPAAALTACHAQVAELKRELAMHDQMANRSKMTYEPFSTAQKEELREAVRQYLEGTLPELEVISVRHVKETYEQMKALYQAQAHELATARAALAHAPAEACGGARLRGGADEAVPVEVVEVGELLGGAAFGVAPPDARPADGQALALAAGRRGGGEADAPPSAAAGDSLEAAAAAEEEESGAPAGSAAEYFAEFKRGDGVEVNKMLLENKASLRELRGKQRAISRNVNATKREIDELKAIADHKRELRQQGELKDVIDEEEFACLSKLKASKQRYRELFDELREARSDAEYVGSLVESCRQQLLADFERWVRLRDPAVAPHGLLPPPPEPPARELDADEEFDSIADQMALTADPDSLPFMKAAKHASARGSPSQKRGVGRKGLDGGSVAKPARA
ncbi:hypothetical protein AB1Y20_011437 [Prymnesium parvum]|uniref:Kinesin-like protein n=1 Tax=Prymnesium parvum TaxID=97485 RepID=A0AB34ILV0_PRYPA